METELLIADTAYINCVDLHKHRLKTKKYKTVQLSDPAAQECRCLHVKWTSGCITRCRLSFTSVITGFNVLADQCLCLSPPSVSFAAIMIVTDKPRHSLSSYKEKYKKIQTITLSVSQSGFSANQLQQADICRLLYCLRRPS